MFSHIGHVQSLGPKSPGGPPGPLPRSPPSGPPLRPLPRPPPNPPPPPAPAGRAVPHRLQTPRKAKFTLVQQSHHRPWIWAQPVSFLLPGLPSWLSLASSSPTSSHPTTPTVIYRPTSTSSCQTSSFCSQRIHVVSHQRGHWTGIQRLHRFFTLCLSNKNIDYAAMKIFIVKPFNCSRGSIRVFIRYCCISLGSICRFITIDPYLWAPGPLIFLEDADGAEVLSQQDLVCSRRKVADIDGICGRGSYHGALGRETKRLQTVPVGQDPKPPHPLCF
eukprot:c19914_g1_i2 orf=12-836(-)